MIISRSPLKGNCVLCIKIRSVCGQDFRFVSAFSINLCNAALLFFLDWDLWPSFIPFYRDIDNLCKLTLAILIVKAVLVSPKGMSFDKRTDANKGKSESLLWQ